MPPVIDSELCNFCGICYDICPQNVFAVPATSQDGSPAMPAGNLEAPPLVAYPQECWYCGGCVVDCPTDAIHLRLPLPLHIVPSPALYGPPGKDDEEALRRAADFSRSTVADQGKEARGV